MTKEISVKEAKDNLQNMLSVIEQLENKQNDIAKVYMTAYSIELEKIRSLKNELLLKLNHLENGNDQKWEEANNAFNESAEIFKESAGKLTLIIEESNLMK